GIHHNPTPGPAGSPYVYGHIWVVLGLLAVHPAWGVIALPLLARLYVRAKDRPGINPKHRPEFRTKLELAVELLRWAHAWLRYAGKPLWVAVDGAYAKAPFLKPAKALGMTVVSRLRRDAALFTVPGPRPPGRRGRPRIYGEGRIGLAKRAGQRRGWTTGSFVLYGERVRKRYKTVEATWRPAGGRGRLGAGGRAAGRRADPRGAGGRAGGVGGLLLHRRDGERRGDPRGRGRSVRAGDGLPRSQGGRRGRSAAGAVRVGEHRCAPSVPLDLHDD